MEIRAIVHQDLKSISQLYISVFSNSPWNEHWEYTSAYERLNWVFQSQGFRGFIAIDKDRTIGAILGRFVPFEGKKGFEIVEFLVDAGDREQGLGTKLLLELETELKQNQYNFIVLLTSKDTGAESFYLKRSYQRDDKLVLLRKKI